MTDEELMVYLMLLKNNKSYEDNIGCGSIFLLILVFLVVVFIGCFIKIR